MPSPRSRTYQVWSTSVACSATTPVSVGCVRAAGRPAARCRAPRRRRRRRARASIGSAAADRHLRVPPVDRGLVRHPALPEAGALRLRRPVPRGHLRIEHVERAEHSVSNCGVPPAQQVGARAARRRYAGYARSGVRGHSRGRRARARSGRRCRGGGPGRRRSSRDRTGPAAPGRPRRPRRGTPAPSARSASSHNSFVPCVRAMMPPRWPVADRRRPPTDRDAVRTSSLGLLRA